MSELESVRTTVMRRDGISTDEFDEMLEGFLGELEECGMEQAEDLIAEWFGLEPDYLWDAELGVFG